MFTIHNNNLAMAILLVVVATILLGGGGSNTRVGARPATEQEAEQQKGQQQAEQPQQQTGPSSLQKCLEKIAPVVCDPSGLLSQEQAQKLDAALEQLNKQTIQENYAFDKTQREKCGQRGITMPLVLLKENSQDFSSTEKMLVDMNKEWSVKNPCDRVAILMLNAADKVEQRRFWAGRNWNVNVEPSEMIKLYEKENDYIVKADYVQALLNILREFTQMAAKAPVPTAVNADAKVVQQKVGPSSAKGAAATVAEQKDEIVKSVESSVPVSSSSDSGSKSAGEEEQKKNE